METLEKSRMCRLCGKQSGISIDIFDKNENHVRKINAILPLLVHEMDLLPKQMCHRCSYKLEEFYNFYVECAKTDTEFKNQLSWMRKENLEEKIVTPMVKMNRFKIKTELPDNDCIDPNGVFGHFSENPLLFPASILQHSFDPNPSPMLSCSRCRCLCNRSVKVNKKSPKDVKSCSKIESENQPHSSSVNSNNSTKIDVSDKSKNTDKNVSFSKDLTEDENIKEVNKKEIVIINLDNNLDNHYIKSESINNTNLLKNEQLNRALRPRKSSIDYTGPKKKGLATNLKVKFKSKLDMLDPSLVNPINIKLSHNNLEHANPVIKLEKVDDTMRTQKNLEEFNKRIKEFQHNKILPRHGGIHGKKILRREEILGRRNILEGEKLHKRSSKREKNQNRRSLQKEENLNKKVLQIDENPSRRSLQREENAIRKSLQKEENPIKKNSHREESQTKKSLQTEENKIEEHLNLSMTNSINEGINSSTLNIKQEDVNKKIDSNELLKEKSTEEKILAANVSKELKTLKPSDRLSLCAVVKLEKGYMCNVDYPRVKIKKHSAMINSSKPQESTLQVSQQQKNDSQPITETKSSENNDDAIRPKNLRSKEKRLRHSNSTDKSEKVIKKKSKSLDANFKKVVSEKGSSSATQTDLKCYCEECDTCFQNKELYKLHPCYQK